eukprot:6640467-Prymnesium_polylepis.1
MGSPLGKPPKPSSAAAHRKGGKAAGRSDSSRPVGALAGGKLCKSASEPACGRAAAPTSCFDVASLSSSFAPRAFG